MHLAVEKTSEGCFSRVSCKMCLIDALIRGIPKHRLCGPRFLVDVPTIIRRLYVSVGAIKDDTPLKADASFGCSLMSMSI